MRSLLKKIISPLQEMIETEICFEIVCKVDKFIHQNEEEDFHSSFSYVFL